MEGRARASSVRLGQPKTFLNIQTEKRQTLKSSCLVTGPFQTRDGRQAVRSEGKKRNKINRQSGYLSFFNQIQASGINNLPIPPTQTWSNCYRGTPPILLNLVDISEWLWLQRIWTTDSITMELNGTRHHVSDTNIVICLTLSQPTCVFLHFIWYLLLISYILK